jgi:hypothetical protein
MMLFGRLDSNRLPTDVSVQVHADVSVRRSCDVPIVSLEWIEKRRQIDSCYAMSLPKETFVSIRDAVRCIIP